MSAVGIAPGLGLGLVSNLARKSGRINRRFLTFLQTCGAVTESRYTIFSKPCPGSHNESKIDGIGRGWLGTRSARIHLVFHLSL